MHDTIESHLLGSVSGGGNTHEAMSGLVESRLRSSFGNRGFVRLAGASSFGPDKHGFVMGHGHFSISDNFRGVEMRSWNAVVDVHGHRVQHLQTRHVWTGD